MSANPPAQPDRTTRAGHDYCVRLLCLKERTPNEIRDAKATLNAYADQCERDLDAVHSDCQEALGHLHDAEVKLEKALQRTKDDATTIKALVTERDKANDRARQYAKDLKQMEIRLLRAELRIAKDLTPITIQEERAKRARLAQLEGKNNNV